MKENDEPDESENRDEPETNNKFIKIKTYLMKRYDLRFNTLSLDLEVSKKGKNEWKPLEPADLDCELFEHGYTGFDKHVAAFIKSHYVKRFDPVKEYFENLPEWDQKTDWITTLASYVKVTDQDFYYGMFRKMLIRSAAQMLGMLKFNKHCFTFYGKQNDGKTYFLRYLCPPGLVQYMKDNIDFEGKDSKRSLAENVWINLDELSSLSKTDINKAKAMFAESTIKMRLPYDRKDSIMPRKASFVASTNQREFLVDETGNVRWLVFEVLSILHDNGGRGGYQAVDMDKVWAQAYYLLMKGEDHQLTRDEIAHSEKNNRQFGKDTLEYEMLVSLYQKPSNNENAMFKQPKDLLLELSTIAGGRITLFKENIGRALVKMGIEPTQKRIGQYPVKGYMLEPTPKLLELTPPSQK